MSYIARGIGTLICIVLMSIGAKVVACSFFRLWRRAKTNPIQSY